MHFSSNLFIFLLEAEAWFYSPFLILVDVRQIYMDDCSLRILIYLHNCEILQSVQTKRKEITQIQFIQRVY